MQKRIDLDYIEPIFKDNDLERAIMEATNYFQTGQPHTEKILHNLTVFFLENPPNDSYSYILSDYAHRFLKLIGKKLFNEHTHFPLRKTFKDYGLFKSENIKTIEDFRAWYQYNFQNSSKENILDHLEALKDLVNKSVIKLNELSNTSDTEAINNLDEFVSRFKDIASKSDEIAEILRLSSILNIEILKVTDSFGNKITDFPHPETEAEKELLNSIKLEYDNALDIQKEVTSFFNLIDLKLQQIVDRSLYASDQLEHFKENFRNHSIFRINLKKFLQFTLENATYSKSNLVELAEKFPLKSIPYQDFKFISPKYYDDFLKKRNYVKPVTFNKQYAEEENQKASELLRKQELSAKLLRKYKDILKETKRLDFTNHFYNILEDEKDSEVALTVCYDLVRFANENEEYTLNINRELPENYKLKDILIWQIVIQAIA